MGKEVYKYVKGCTQCQRNKVNTQTKKAPLNPITPIENTLPFQTIVMDFIVKLCQIISRRRRTLVPS